VGTFPSSNKGKREAKTSPSLMGVVQKFGNLIQIPSQDMKEIATT
jgi:hypothetical protein